MCRTGASEARRRKRDERIADVAAGLIQVEHGTLRGYAYYGCRCPDCRRANAEYSRAWHAGLRTGGAV